MSGTAPSVLITGANRGIGLEFTRQYEQADWRVYAGCRDPDTASDVNELVSWANGMVSAHRLDVTNPRHINNLAQELAGQPIDILINNAGIYGNGPGAFGQVDEARWVSAFLVNAIAPLKIMEAFVDHVAYSQQRIIAVLSSKMGSMADNRSGGSYVYRSSKAALNAVVKSAAIDLAPQGITVVALHPGWVLTDMGGPGAELTVMDSVQHMRGILAGLTLADSGKFFDIDGSEIPW